MSIADSAIAAARTVVIEIAYWLKASAERLDVVKTSWKLISEELKQLLELTSATSSGLANVTSTQLYIAAPCCAVSMTCIVRLSPTLNVTFAGRGTCGRQKDPLY